MKNIFPFLLLALLFVSSCKKAEDASDSCTKPGSVSLNDYTWGLEVQIYGNNDFYEIEYGSNGFSKGSGTTATINGSTTLSLSNGAYDFYARGNCGGSEWSEWYGPKSVLVQNGTPPVTCYKPTGASITSAYSGFHWDNSGASIYQIEYGPNGFAHGNGTRALTNSTSYSDYSLAANTTYDFYVRGICASGDTSEWSNAVLFYNANNWRMCLPPTNITVNRTGGCIEYDFDSNGEATFETVLNTTPTTNFTNPDPTTSTGGAYCGVYSNVTYYFYVRSVCKNGSKTSWAGPFTIY